MFQITGDKHTSRNFKFKRLAFEINFVPTTFQQVIDTMLIGLDYAIADLDNILLKRKKTALIEPSLCLCKMLAPILYELTSLATTIFLWIVMCQKQVWR